LRLLDIRDLEMLSFGGWGFPAEEGFAFSTTVFAAADKGPA